MGRTGRPEPVRPIILNAMNLGSYLDGIGSYTFNLLRELAAVADGPPIVVYLNRTAALHVARLRIPEKWDIVWMSGLVSPDNGFRGHLLRLLVSNFIGMLHPRSLVVTTSQLEALFFHTRQVVTIHDVIPLLFRTWHRKQYFYFRHLLPFALRRAQAVVTPSRHTKGLIEQVYRIPHEKIRVIYNGVHLAGVTEPGGTVPVQPFILYAGRLVRMKNIDGVLRAFSLVQQIIPHTLVIVGHGREGMSRMFTSAKLEEYGIARDRVVLLGHVSFEEIAALLRRADALVFPSFYEGFGLPPLEAMKAGCPVVVSQVGSLPEVCGDAALYVDPYDTEGIAQGIFAVLSNERLRRQLIQRGLERAASFTWKRATRSLLEVIAEVQGAGDLDEAGGALLAGVSGHINNDFVYTASVVAMSQQVDFHRPVTHLESGPRQFLGSR